MKRPNDAAYQYYNQALPWKSMKYIVQEIISENNVALACAHRNGFKAKEIRGKLWRRQRNQPNNSNVVNIGAWQRARNLCALARRIVRYSCVGEA